VKGSENNRTYTLTMQLICTNSSLAVTTVVIRNGIQTVRLALHNVPRDSIGAWSNDTEVRKIRPPAEKFKYQ
jgi:hypothetical protein